MRRQVVRPEPRIGRGTVKLRRVDKLNMCVETYNGAGWSVYGYFGNSARSLAVGLVLAVVATYDPDEAASLADLIEVLRLAVAEGVRAIERAVVVADL